MKIFLFDIGNVLVNYDLNTLYAKLSADAGVSELSPQDWKMHDAAERGEISDAQYVDYLNKTYRMNWSVETLIQIWQDTFRIQETGRALFLKAIERGIPVYTLSNIADHHIAAIERNWPGFFDGATGLFYSYKVGARKPDQEIYRRALNALQTPAEQCFFIDDLADNVAAARAAGINAVQFVPENFAEIKTVFRSFETE